MTEERTSKGNVASGADHREDVRRTLTQQKVRNARNAVSSTTFKTTTTVAVVTSALVNISVTPEQSSKEKERLSALPHMGTEDPSRSAPRRYMQG